METLSSVKLEQPLNIQPISVTLEVLKLETLRDVKLEQPLNIWLIFVTEEVLKLETLRDVKPEQPSNIKLIFVTEEVLRFSSPSIVVRAERLENQPLVVVGLKSLNEALNTTLVTTSLGDSYVPAQTGIELLDFSSISQVLPLRNLRLLS